MADADANESNHESDQQMLLAFVAERDAPCPACGYNLRMLSKPICPECGLALKLTVGSDVAYRRAWAITLCTNAMVAGAGLFFLLITLAEGGPNPQRFLEYLWYTAPILWIPVPIILFGIRRWFCGLKTGVQQTAVVVSIIWIIVWGWSLVYTL